MATDHSGSSAGGGPASGRTPRTGGGSGGGGGGLGPPQLTPGASFIQAECVQLMKKIQELDREFAQKEAALRQEKDEFQREKEHAEFKMKTDAEAHQARMQLEKEQAECKLKTDVMTHQTRVQWEKEDLKERRRSFEELKQASDFVADSQKEHLITIDVGGEKFRTDLRTLARHPDSIFPKVARMVGQHQPPHKPRSENIFIDRDSKHFRFILNYMRQGEEVMRGTALRNKDKYDFEELLCEVRYYRLHGLQDLLKRHMIRMETKPIKFQGLVIDNSFAATNQKIPNALMYATTKQLLFKEMNMKDIVFESVHFKHTVSFEGSILEGAKFRQCRFDAAVKFTGADISRMCFDHCINVSPDRLEMDGKMAAKCGVTVNPSVDLREFSTDYL